MKNRNKKHSGDVREETSDRENSAEENNALYSDKEGSKKQHKDAAARETDELKKKASEYDALWNKYLRLCADFDNARKRWDKDRQDLIKFANTSLIKNLLVIVDEFEHALRAIEEHSQCDEAIIKGVKLTYNNLLSVLNKEGLKVIEAKGKRFDPHIHEIVGQVEDLNVEEHTVVDEIQKGYLLGDSLLRTSKVIIAVSKAQAETGDGGTNSTEHEKDDEKE